MKKLNYLLLVALTAIIGIGLVSCSKEETTKAQMIVKNWTLTSKKVLNVEAIQDCEKDNVWNFKSDGSYTIDPGSKKCTELDKLKAGTWKLSSDAKTLTLDNITAYKVEEISLTKLVIKLEVANVGLTEWTFK